MLHDRIHPAEIDAEAALEFMKEATKLASATELEGIGTRLTAKSAIFREHLAADRIGTLDSAGLDRVLDAIFSLRRKTKRLLRATSIDVLRPALDQLLHAPEPIEQRFDGFLARVGGLERGMIISLASEALHFTDPDRYWLWTHWLWNPSAGTGALALVTSDGHDLKGASDGQVYLKVGHATAMLSRHGQQVGYTRAGRGLFGTDVFLACVYAVYMFTVFRVKLSQEFNRILPELPELVCRVLGVNHLKGTAGEGAHATGT